MSAPARVPVHPGLFEEDADGTVALLGSRCRACGRATFPRSAACPYCAASDVEAVRLAGAGTLWGWTTVHTAPPGYEGPVPFGFGVVELTEGLRVVTRLELGDAPARFGLAMRATVVPLHADERGATVVTYAFEPAP